MIIFDDYRYAEKIMDNTAPPCINRNNILRSCAKAVNEDFFGYSEMLSALQKYERLQVTDELFMDYVKRQERNPLYKPHEISFGLAELRNIYRLPRKLERKYYLYQLFLFKYFEVHKIRVAQREVKRLANINPNHLSLNTFHLGRGIYIRREKQTAYGALVLKDYSTNKPYTYYYPKEKRGKTVFTYLYEGDCFMQPNIPFESNLDKLYENYLEAAELYMLPKDKAERLTDGEAKDN